MEYVIGVMAMLVSFFALWLASSNRKKIEEGNKALKTQIKDDMDKTLKKLEEKIDNLEENASTFDAKMKAVMETQAQYKEAVAILEKKLAKTIQKLSA